MLGGLTYEWATSLMLPDALGDPKRAAPANGGISGFIIYAHSSDEIADNLQRYHTTTWAAAERRQSWVTAAVGPVRAMAGGQALRQPSQSAIRFTRWLALAGLFTISNPRETRLFCSVRWDCEQRSQKN